MKNVIIIGASGHGKVIAEIVKASGDNLIGFLDDDTSKKTLGTLSDYEKFQDSYFIIGIGDNKVREKLSSFPIKWYTAIHPTAVISPSAKIGEGTVVMPNAVINTEAVIGKHTIINTSAVIEHEDKIGDFCHIAVGVKLGGNVKIGNSTFIGLGTSIINNVSVCDNCKIGGGAVVIDDIEVSGTYVGVSVRKIK